GRCTRAAAPAAPPALPLRSTPSQRIASWTRASSERETQATRHRAGPWIREIVDATYCRSRAREHLGIEARIPGQKHQIVGGDVQPGAARRPRQQRYVELIVHLDVLEAHERAALDPARRINRRLVDPGRVGEGGPQEVLVLQRIALRRSEEHTSELQSPYDI